MRLGDPSDQVTCGVYPAPGVSVKNRWDEANIVRVTSVRRAVERPFEGFILRQVFVSWSSLGLGFGLLGPE